MFTKMTRRAFVALVALCVPAACSPNPNGVGVADYGAITGTVVDRQSLQPISGATIQIGNAVVVTAPVDNGTFTLRNIPVGTRNMVITAIGWQTYSMSVTVDKNRTVAIPDPIGLLSTIAPRGPASTPAPSPAASASR